MNLEEARKASVEISKEKEEEIYEILYGDSTNPVPKVHVSDQKNNNDKK